MAGVNPGLANLIAWWSLNETSGNRLDSHGANHLTPAGSVSYAAGKVGNAADFERATSDYLTIADNAALSMGDVNLSIVVWVNFETAVGAVTNNVLSKFESNTAGKREYAIDWDSPTNRLRFFVRNTADTAYGVATANTLGAPSVGAWYMIHGYHDAVANVVGISVNGGAADTTAHTTGIYDGTSAFRIGYGPFGTSNYADSLIDEVAVYKGRVLTADEITWLYNGGAGRAYRALSPAGDAPISRPLSPAFREAFG